VQQDLSRLAVEIEINEDVLLNLVMVPKVVRIELISPWAAPLSGSRANTVVVQRLSPGRWFEFQGPGLDVP
jgi:hypothetical protein